MNIDPECFNQISRLKDAHQEELAKLAREMNLGGKPDISLEVQELEDFVVKLQAEIADLKTKIPQSKGKYDPELIKIMYEISDSARRVGGYISLLRNRTADSDRWVLNRLTELGCKITHSEALINE